MISAVIKNNSKLVTVDGNPATDISYTYFRIKLFSHKELWQSPKLVPESAKAMVGGRGVTGKQLYNRAINPRQPGSSIKPLAVYSAALQSIMKGEYIRKYPLWSTQVTISKEQIITVTI